MTSKQKTILTALPKTSTISKQAVSDTPAGGGDISPAAVASDHLPEVVVPDEGAAVVEPPPLDNLPAVVGSDVISNDERMELAFEIAGLENEVKRKGAMVEALTSANELAQQIIEHREADNKCLAAENQRLRAENIALKILDETMPGFGAAHEALKNARYLVADSYIIINDRAEAQRAALQIALDSESTAVIASINGAERVSINPVWEEA